MADQPTPPPPPRPGDPVPTGGLDPSQVFSSPPPPPPQQAAQAGAAAGQQGGGPPPPPADAGPPPPPPGVTATKEMGYDDEDLKILAQVGNYRFGSVTVALTNDKVAVPTHPETNFDEQKFLTLLRGSISLTRDEKWRILHPIPQTSPLPPLSASMPAGCLPTTHSSTPSVGTHIPDRYPLKFRMSKHFFSPPSS